MSQHHKRLERLRDTIRSAYPEADALVVADERNVRYLTGFTGDASVLIVCDNRALMVSDGRYTTQLAQECPWLEVHIRPVGQPLPIGVAETIDRLEFRRVLFESSAVTVATFQVFQDKAPSASWKAAGGLVEGLRVIKDETEVAEIRESIGMAESAFATIRSRWNPEATEKELADDIEHALRRAGATAAAFPPIVAAGPHAALPHARPRDTERLGNSDFVLIDWGASARPYHSDLTRLVIVGKVTPELERVYRTVLAAQEAAIAAIRPGVTAGLVDAEARSVIDAAGFGDCFTHGLGHGIGLQIHEAPWLRRDEKTELRPGMVLTVEPGIYLPDWGGVRIEDDVLITPDGAEVLTSVPKRLEESILA